MRRREDVKEDRPEVGVKIATTLANVDRWPNDAFFFTYFFRGGGDVGAHRKSQGLESVVMKGLIEQ